MARIISGQANPEDAGFAFLAGYEGARKQRVEEQQAQQAMMMRQLQLAMQMQDATVQHAYQQAKTQELLNQQAGAGDLAALQELSLRSQMDPEHAQAEQALGILQNIKDPDMRKEAAGHIKQVIAAQRAQKAYHGVGQRIEGAVTDGLIDEGQALDYQTRLRAKQQSGESADDILTELSGKRQKRALEGHNEDESLQALAQAEQLIQTAKPGRNRKLAEIAIRAFRDSPSLQREEGAGEKMLAAVQKTLVGSAKEYEEANAKKQFADLSPMEGPGAEKLRMQELESGFADYPQFAAKKNAQKEGRYPGSTTQGRNGTSGSDGMDQWIPSEKYGGRPIKQNVGRVVYRAIDETRSKAEFKKALRDAGLDINDPDVLEEVKRAMEARRNDVAANAGADR